MMDVYLDNEKTDCIDFYVDGDQKKQIVFEKEGLEDGKHTILLRGNRREERSEPGEPRLSLMPLRFWGTGGK